MTKIAYEGNVVDFESLTDRLQKIYKKTALVEVSCGLPHDSIYVPGIGKSCRYARGFVTHKESGLMIKAHECHLCSCYRALKANTPKEKRVCDNCGGPLIISPAEESCWPSEFMSSDWID